MLWTDGFGMFGRGLDPWSEFQRIENEMNRVLSRFVSPSTGDFPAVNIWTDGEETLVTTEIPGIEAGAIDISVAGKTLILKGAREPEQLDEGNSYHRRERWYGQFTKAIELPFTINAEKVGASFANGILTITLPRSEAEKPKKITIKSA
ncbi:MAG: Hsp20/alpha crystallin family protein [Syntrophorhabdaceae bacterium]|nr:Hsp20/alpha crystallin family protein [Syntrophorhabdaceae bacterium]